MNRFALAKSLTPIARLALLGVSFLTISVFSAEPPAFKPPAPPGTYLNPLGDPPIHLSEPFILTHAKRYYLFGTAAAAEGFQCYESDDLVHWGFDGWAWRKTGLHVARGELHSPQVFPYQSMFCLVYSARMPTGIQLGLAASLKPEGPYHDLHVPWLTLGEGCVAGDVFVDSNGKAYLTFTQTSKHGDCNYRTVYGVGLSKDLSKMLGEPVRFLEASQRWELAQRNSIRFNDAARMVRLGSKYYLTYCANDPQSSDCAIGYAVADKPLGPWTKGVENPIVRTHPEIGVLGPCHGAVFGSLDRSGWWMVYDSLTDPTNHPEDRVMNLDRVLLHGNSSIAVNGPTRSPQPLLSGAK
jgi:hypothetical protein